MALGATATSVRWLIVRQGASAAAPGLILGVILTLALTSFGQSLFVGIGRVDPQPLVLGVAAIVTVVMAASYWPRKKATRIHHRVERVMTLT